MFFFRLLPRVFRNGAAPINRSGNENRCGLTKRNWTSTMPLWESKASAAKVRAFARRAAQRLRGLFSATSPLRKAEFVNAVAESNRPQGRTVGTASRTRRKNGESRNVGCGCCRQRIPGKTLRGKELAPQVKQRVFHGGETPAKRLILNGLLKETDSDGRTPSSPRPRRQPIVIVNSGCQFQSEFRQFLVECAPSVL